MPTSSRLNIPYPSEGTDPWYDAFVSMVEAVDASGYASREDRNLVLMGGGTFSYNQNTVDGTAQLVWTRAIQISSPTTGFLGSIPAGNVVLQDGGMLFTDLVRAPTSSVSLSPFTGQAVTSSDTAYLLGIRSGPTFYFRNGKVLTDGDSFAALELNGNATGTAPKDFKESCRVATLATVLVSGSAPNVVDSVTLLAGDRVLVKAQTSSAENGIYRVDVLGTGANGTWVRSSDFNTSAVVSPGALVAVTEGTYAGFVFELSAPENLVLGTTPLAFITSTPMSTTAPVDVTVSAAVIGTALKPSREDHAHHVPTAAPATFVVGGSQVTGTSSSLSRADHQHAAPAFGTGSGTFCQGNDARLTAAPILIFGPMLSGPFAPGTYYLSPGDYGVAQATPCPIPRAGTLLAMYVSCIDAAQGDSMTYTLVKNGSNSSLSVVIMPGDTEGTDLTHTVSILPGDTVFVSATAGALIAGSATRAFVTMVFAN